jgi:hypothetical protein
MSFVKDLFEEDKGLSFWSPTVPLRIPDFTPKLIVQSNPILHTSNSLDPYKTFGISSGLVTPSIIHIKTPYMQDVFNKDPEFLPVKLFPVVQRCLEREVQFREDYVVFYHGLHMNFLIPQLFYEILYEKKYGKKLEDFVFLRTKNISDSCGTLKKYKEDLDLFQKSPKFGPFSAFDHKPDVQPCMLSTNLAIFGNAYPSDECSWYFFTHGLLLSNVDEEGIVEGIYKSFGYQFPGLNLKLFRYVNEDQGMLLQIFIPRTLVNKIAYPCYKFGHTKSKQWPIDLHDKTMLEVVDNYPFFKEEFRKMPFINAVQARILLNENFTQANGIKIFRYFNETDQTIMLKKLINAEISKSVSTFEK